MNVFGYRSVRTYQETADLWLGYLFFPPVRHDRQRCLGGAEHSSGQGQHRPMRAGLLPLLNKHMEAREKSIPERRGNREDSEAALPRRSGIPCWESRSQPSATCRICPDRGRPQRYVAPVPRSQPSQSIPSVAMGHWREFHGSDPPPALALSGSTVSARHAEAAQRQLWYRCHVAG